MVKNNKNSDKGRNLIVLSDGTGNGAAKKNKTNVYRLYESLDLHDRNQIAFYDDGVGSQDFLPKKILGSVFGLGLEKNVLELYKFICRNYQTNDRIYLFGFSRGAFTVRMLAGIITTTGLVTNFNSERHLDRMARYNFNIYRNKFKRGIVRRLFFAIFSLIKGIFQKKEIPLTLTPGIEFIGVWDTVGAYGFPIEELAIIWDFLIWPIRFQEQGLSDDVKKACHALSLDDERKTFHPILWNENNKENDRIEQVWFPGVHSDVGGGYPMPELAFITLDWMMDKVELNKANKKGLIFIKDKREEYRQHADWHGKQHDSRAGLGTYYRYKPRIVEEFCNDKKHNVFIKIPKIHRSVFERIKGNVSHFYSPLGLTSKYRVVATRGKVPQYEKDIESVKRHNYMEPALDYVFWRKWIYYAFLSASIIFIILGYKLEYDPNTGCDCYTCILNPLFVTMKFFAPVFTHRIIGSLMQNPWYLYGSLFTGILLFFLQRWSFTKVQRFAVNAWAKLKGMQQSNIASFSLTFYLRKALNRINDQKFSFFLPFILFCMIFLVIASGISHLAFFMRNRCNDICHFENTGKKLNVGETTEFKIDPGDACAQPLDHSGVNVRKGEKYTFVATPVNLKDGDNEVTDLDKGFSKSYLIPFILFRRSVSEPWFKLFAGVNGDSNSRISVGKGLTDYRFESDGDLYFYLNDAVFGFLPGKYWDLTYSWPNGKNTGSVIINIKRIE